MFALASDDSRVSRLCLFCDLYTVILSRSRSIVCCYVDNALYLIISKDAAEHMIPI